MRASCTLLAVLVLGMQLPGRAPAQDKVKDSPYYPLKVGTRWVYRSGGRSIVVRLVKREPVGDIACARLEAAEGSEVKVEHVAVRPDGVYRYQADGKKIEPPLRILEVAPRAGASWKVDSTLNDQPIRGTFTIGEAEVTVPAGKYKALVVASPDFEIAGRRLAVTYWFAPGVGLVKQRVEDAGMEVVLELQSFTQPD